MPDFQFGLLAFMHPMSNHADLLLKR